MATLNSKIILAKGINIDREYINVLSYNTTNLLALLNNNSHYVASSDTFSFIGGKNTKIISTPFTYEQCLQANYIAFQNPSYSNKWFFAFITNVIYRSNGNTQIEFEIDAWSTWFENWQKKPCYIIREHVNNDTIGANTVPENLDIGDVVQLGEIEDISLSEYFWVAVSTAWLPNGSSGGEQFSGVSLYNKQISGNKIILFQVNNAQSIIDLGLYIIRTNSDGHIADIQDIYIVPDAVIEQSQLTQHTCTVGNYTFNYYTLPYSMDIEEFNTNIPKVNSYSDYTPKNNKCFVYPYNYLFVSNNIGNSNIFKYENFSNGSNATFKTQIALTVGCNGRLVPTGYKGQTTADDDALPLAKYPTCGWSSDAFTNWLTQEAVNQATSMAFGVLGASQQKSEVGMATSIAGIIANQIGNFYTGSLMPNIQGGQNTGSINFGANRNTFTFRQMRCKLEYLKIIDDYFSRFGYAINRVLEPNIIGRQNFNYVEIGSTEEIGTGNVPVEFMEKINNACRRGITIWHNHENIGNYNVTNTIVT